MDAARHWARAVTRKVATVDEAAEDLRRFGWSDEQIAEALRDQGPEDADAFDLWPGNERALELFLACRRQWQVGPLGGVLGLRAEGVESVLRMKRTPAAERSELFEDLQRMAEAALPLLNRKDKDR